VSHSSHRRRALLIACVLAVSAAFSAGAASRLTGDLPRVGAKPLEDHPGIDTEYAELDVGGARLRTIVTRPAGAAGRLPAIQFLQWLSCDSVEIPPDASDGWNRMLTHVVRESRALVLRVDKSGVGDSLGPACAELDYDTELAFHRAALRALRARPDVDPDRIVLLGASMGSNFAPLVARNERLAGVAVWGGGARTWYERQLAFDRRALDLGRRPANELAAAMLRHAEFQLLYLERRMTPAQIAAERPTLAGVWSEIVGAEGDLHYGRPLAFHWQAQQQDWAGAWAQVDAPVLAILGEHDWFEDPRSAELIARIVNRRKPGNAEFHLVPRMDHHFELYPSAEAAFSGADGTPDARPALAILMPWLEQRLRPAARDP
jgi:dienelactone hydrolase